MADVMSGVPNNMHSSVLHRNMNTTPPKISHGSGISLFDASGKRYIDACGGAAVSCLGHSNTFVIDAVKKQLDSVPYVHSGFFTSDATEELADKLITLTGANARAALFFSSGSEAMEAAFKISRQFHIERGEINRTHIISRRQSYHGTTMGALGIGGLVNRKKPFSDWLMTSQVSYVETCYAYRNKLESEDLVDYTARLVREFEDEVLQIGPQNVAAFVAETVAGATLGVVPPTIGYYKGIRKVCDQYGILLILDEVMCGMGRCGEWMACHAEGVAPDVICVAKGLGGGYQPISAMVVNKKIYGVISENSGAFMHGQTYMGHATACAAAFAVISRIEAEGLINRVERMGHILQECLTTSLSDNPYIGDIRGRGLFWGVELVKDRNSKEPFPKHFGLHKIVKEHAMENGVLVYSGGGALEGGCGDHIMLSPPYIVSSDELLEISEKLQMSVQSAIKSIGINS